ncbi:histidinol phosphate aminotransferase [Desulfitobacterium sp. LBE]|uniref:histidinol-phosphate transaminase n=1 Tax=Desulfitobacterium sp. LBE TaxID=884086 RepID=UPI0011992091|nr:histidinol-phosphate transaminase [Desulfitobacterium sp. LBE]TWH57618.1 histidinol phosphate aminotransferase [Desulfitobacterium sp. LBE]
MVDKMNLEQWMRPSIRTLKAYESKSIPDCVRLDANENPLPWPPGMIEQLLGSAIAFNRYPDGGAQELKEALSRYTGVPAEGILTGNGSDELIQLLMTTFGGEKGAVVIHPPTFSMYEAAARVTGTGVLEVPLLLTETGRDFRLDVEGILKAAARPQVHMIVLCNPNNPTGTLFPREEILRIVAESGKIVIVDEAYGEFSGESVVDQIPYCPNLLVMKTFSKLFAMAALRLGYLLGQPSIIEALNRARQPFNVNSFSQKAGAIALNYGEEYAEQGRVLITELEKIVEALTAFSSVKVFATRANFVLFQPEDPDRVYQELIGKGFLIRNMGNQPLVGKALRLSAGLPEDNERLIKALEEILK